MNHVRFLVLALPALAGFSCSPYQQTAGAWGGLAGAMAGAAFGDDHQDVVAGAAVGAALGAGGAAAHEESRRRQQGSYGTRDYDRYGIPPQQRNQTQRSGYGQDYEQRSYERAPALDDSLLDEPAAEPEYPVARRSNDPGQVFSPYAPNQRIDVTGFRSGQLAKDPRNGKIFRVP